MLLLYISTIYTSRNRLWQIYLQLYGMLNLSYVYIHIYFYQSLFVDRNMYLLC